jgi:hypothetical protein
LRGKPRKSEAMKKIVTVLLFTVGICFIGFTQHKIITDSTLIGGLVLRDGYVGKSVDYNCLSSYDKRLDSATLVMVCGAKRCSGIYSSEPSDFFEIFYRKCSYFIERSKLLIGKMYSFEDILNLTAEEASQFKEKARGMSDFLYKEEIATALSFLDNAVAISSL